MVADVLESFLNWDSKFFTTIALLILKPWRLTNEFLAGKRVRYVNPLRLYLLASILFFFAVNYGTKGLKFEPGNIDPKDRAEIEADLKKEDLPPAAREKLEAWLREAPAQASPASASPTPTTAPSPTAGPYASATSPDTQKLQYGKIGERPFVIVDSSSKSSTPFERWIEGRAKEKMGEHGTKMGLFISTLFSNLPYMMLCCIPLFALVLKLLYIRGRIFYIYHLIYALHIHSFFYAGIMLLVLATIGVTFLGPGAIAGLLIAFLSLSCFTQFFLSFCLLYCLYCFLC